MSTKTSEIIAAELRAVNEIVDALDVTIHESQSPETLACMSHGLAFLEDHLRRLYGIEEQSELLDIIVNVHPEFEHAIHRLQTERDAIRAEAHRLVLALCDLCQPTNASLHAVMYGLRHLIANILKHEHHERAVVIDAINVDQGGEG